MFNFWHNKYSTLILNIGMFKKIIDLIRENRRNQKEILKYLKELDWANVYRDSTNGKVFLNELSLNVGRWASSYAFLYVLNRILTDFSPNSIMELGLGESTKFISAYIVNEDLNNCEHIVIEEDNDWKNFFLSKNKISSNTEIRVLETENKIVEGMPTKVYKGLENVLSKKYDLYIIDGPIGTKNFSRFDMVRIVEKFKPEDEFILLVDDFERFGEKETIGAVRGVFRKKGILIYESVYYGLKNVLIISTEKFKNTRSF